MTALAIGTAVACLGIGACGYLIGRMHAVTVNRRPGYVPIPMVEAVDNWTGGHLYDQDADGGFGRTDDLMLQTTVAGMDAVWKASEA